MRPTKITEKDHNGFAPQSRLRMCNFHLKNFPEDFFLLLESRHFARENTISENEVLLYFSKFW